MCVELSIRVARSRVVSNNPSTSTMSWTSRRPNTPLHPPMGDHCACVCGPQLFDQHKQNYRMLNITSIYNLRIVVIIDRIEFGAICQRRLIQFTPSPFAGGFHITPEIYSTRRVAGGHKNNAVHMLRPYATHAPHARSCAAACAFETSSLIAKVSLEHTKFPLPPPPPSLICKANHMRHTHTQVFVFNVLCAGQLDQRVSTPRTAYDRYRFAGAVTPLTRSQNHLI